jgi:hypothetical protein
MNPATAPAPTVLPEGFTLRAPWPDELPRLRDLFRGINPSIPHHLRILTRSDPERIVGGFMIGESGSLHLRIRSSYTESPVHDALLTSARSLAEEAGIPRLVATLDGDDLKTKAFYLSRGAELTRTDRYYTGELSVLANRLHPLRKRAAATLDRYRVRPLQATDYDALAVMAQSHRLLNEARAAATLRTAYDHALSHVCLLGEKVIGALLARSMPRAQAYVEVRMVHPDHQSASGPINLLLLAASGDRAIQLGNTTFSLSCQPSKDHETVNLARRLQCRLTRERHTLLIPTVSSITN